MAGDWIKMRGVLLKHPKVLAMADFLAEQKRFVHWIAPGLPATRSAYDYVTRECVTRVTVASLLAFWSAANELATDGILRHANRHSCDDIAGVPEFGEALISVQWVTENKADNSLILQNFQEFNTESKMRSSGAERTARYRERKKLEASQVSSREMSREMSRVTPKKEEKEEKEVEAPHRSRGSRLPLTDLPADWRAWCDTERPDLDPVAVWARFRDHWVAKAGKDGVKLDWLATWRNWVRNEKRRPGGARPGELKLAI